MTRANKVKYIVIHCQAGHGTLKSMQDFWKILGWKSPGYATWIDYDGTPNNLSNYNVPTNGVAGFNMQCLHMSYRGGVEQTNVNKAKDTRTQAQKNAIIREILLMLQWLKDNGNDLQDVMIVGHYHFSTDQNHNGAIESWERIKECPSFDAYSEYAYIMEKYNKEYHKLKLPKNR
ncbi:N-acetylmuramoyl-L-alanine amidase [Flavobacterium psychrophilum]|uniref:N-acetylmuramoyl-L-alanine amidase n=1 Tax=Flavobacterium phage 23T TaxID=1814279 RepID=A0A1B0WNC7_9CAUD|nr:N-acetylmuramoyl-L-alanine amidase [Flavobacterium psychrophilum]YP_009592344.1 endolysin; inhibits RNA polymerase [Flavobacterium phage 23T]ANB41008.1 N-acetylmuramoyl-L-alanine amidase [Flavobacterium phage 23T]MCB5982219.1 N-acetylmuramoyl-L-alanine amidase [Flavobacterium psychrophilum]